MNTRAKLEALLGHTLIHGWHLDGPGPARWGWASVHPCRVRYEGRTLADVAACVAMSARDDVEAQAKACREAIAAGEPRPRYTGADLTGAAP